MSSGCFLAQRSPLTASFYQVQWFVQSLGHSEVKQSFSNGTFKTRLILVLSLPQRGRTNLSAPLKASGRLTLQLYSRHKCPRWNPCLQTFTHKITQSCPRRQSNASAFRDTNIGQRWFISIVILCGQSLIVGMYILESLFTAEVQSSQFHSFLSFIPPNCFISKLNSCRTTK